jgi:ribonuclease P protein component
VSGGSIHVLKTSPEQPTRIGVVTPKLVGNSVARHMVARKIRHAAKSVTVTHSHGFDIAVRAVGGSVETQVKHWENAILTAIEKTISASVKDDK